MALVKRWRRALTIKTSGRKKYIVREANPAGRPRGPRRTDEELTAILRGMTSEGRAQLWRCLVALRSYREKTTAERLRANGWKEVR